MKQIILALCILLFAPLSHADYYSFSGKVVGVKSAPEANHKLTVEIEDQNGNVTPIITNDEARIAPLALRALNDPKIEVKAWRWDHTEWYFSLYSAK